MYVMPPYYCAVGKPVEHFLNQWLLGKAQLVVGSGPGSVQKQAE